MRKIDSDSAFKTGWLVGQLLQSGLNVMPVVMEGVYSDTVEWRTVGPDGEPMDALLTITVEVP